MNKSLTTMAIAEMEIEDKWAGKLWAYTPTVLGRESAAGDNCFGLGIAVANESGYTPLPIYWANFETYDAAADDADRLNKERGLDDEEAIRIICSSMAAGKVNAA